MAHFNKSCSSLPDASYKLALRQKLCTVKERIAALEESLSGAANTAGSSHTPKAERRFKGILEQNLKPSSLPSFKPAETQRDSDSSGSSVPSHLKNVVMKSAVKANTCVSSKTSVSLASAKSAWTNYSRLDSTTILKPETQEANVPSFPKVHRGSKQQNSVTKEQSLTDSEEGVENIFHTKPPKLPERQKPIYLRTSVTQNKVQWESTDPTVPKKSLPGVLDLGSPPPKPNRPSSVDIHRFRRNRKSLDDGPGMKTSLRVAPPPLRLCPSSNHAAALSQQLDEDESYDDIGIMNPRPLPSEEYPSKRTEADLSDDTYEELDDKWMEQAEKYKEHQGSNSGKEDTNHGKVSGEKQEIDGPGNVRKKARALHFEGGKSDLPLNQGEIVYNTGTSEGQWLARKMEGYYDNVKTESVDTGHDEEEPGPMFYQPEAESDIYDDIGAPAEVCSGLNMLNLGEDDVYDDVDNPDTRVSNLPQPTTDEDNVYDNVDSQNHPLPFDRYDIYDEVKEDCIYEMD